ncbi:hypothetical protein [uncultured Prevotella sp.]|nr:hypothetical protein [uncultured Prevotella sp.]
MELKFYGKPSLWKGAVGRRNSEGCRKNSEPLAQRFLADSRPP